MKNRILTVFTALVLCMSAFALPITTAYASTGEDTTPPTLSAKLEDEKLAITATDDISGVEAVYIDNTRVNTLVDGKASVALKDYAGEEKQVTVYAVDYSGNRSKEVKLDNPYYKETEKAPEISSAAPSSGAASTAAPSPTQKPSSDTTASADNSQTSKKPSSAQAGSAQNESSSTEDEETESSVPEGAFTPDGTGSILDSATEQEDEKQFYTITTEDGNVFYLIIDGKRDSQNVYFLNGVTEEDLMALAEKSEGTDGAIEVVTCNCTKKCETGAVNSDCPVCKNDLNGCLGKAAAPTPEESEQPEKEAEEKGGNTGMIILVVIILAAAGGIGYYFKMVRPKQQAALEDEEYEDDVYNEGFEMLSDYDEALPEESDEESAEDSK